MDEDGLYNLQRATGLNSSLMLPLRENSEPRIRVGIGSVWSFVYVFFSNGTPFDSPNRSEVCPCLMTGR
jgi:hypothetical protein